MDTAPQEQGCRRTLFLIALVAGLCLVASVYAWEHNIPLFRLSTPAPPYPTPSVAVAFDFPLQPPGAYGPYVQGLTGPLAVDTRYGAQNPAQGNRPNCFRDVTGGTVPFNQLYHAGVDLFALDETGNVVWGGASGIPVHAVADGVVVFVLDAGREGEIVGIEHLLAGGGSVYSVYWHVARPVVRAGQSVTLGQPIAVVHDMGLNSHLHWEMRTFLDGSRIFPAGTAGARGTCNRQIAGVGYTWDDDPARAHPDYYGYLDPIAFVTAHR
ncbi:MAG: M23 family metallopeptidase [Anaerolineae bacterium]|nr:M23 family metallopeptidase [Anaerolineae bacterium]